MNEAQQLLSATLGLLFPAILLFSRWLRLTFASDPDKPTLPEWSIYGIMLVLSMGLSFAQTTVGPTMIVSLTDLWYVQGLLFFIALIAADIAADATSTKSASNVKKIAAANANSTAPGGKP